MVKVVVTKIRKYSDLSSSDSTVYTNRDSVKVINKDFLLKGSQLSGAATF